MTVALLAAACGLLGPTLPLGDGLEVNGRPMRLSIVYSADPPERVAGRCASGLLARGLFPIKVGTHVAVFDPRDGRQRFASAVAQPGGRTLVILGSAEPDALPRRPAAGFPVPPDARGFLGYRSDDGAETGQFVSSRSTREEAGFYRTALSARGFREAESAPGLLRFARGTTTLLVGIQALGDGAGAAVFVTRFEEKK